MDIKETNKSLGFLNLDKLFQNISRFIELKLEIYELKVKEQIVVIISSIATLTLILSLGLFMLLFFSLALAYYLNSLLESQFVGFVIIGILYMILAVILAMFKDKLITSPLFQALFSDTLTQLENEQDAKAENEDTQQD